jgi:hypothetical protein
MESNGYEINCRTPEAQSRFEEGIVAQRFDGVKIGFAGTHQSDIGFDQTAGMDAAFTGNREARVDDLIDLGKALEVLPDQRQSGMRGQVVGQAFDLKVGHGGAGIFNATIISSPPPLSPAGCGEIHSQPASVQGGGDSGHGFRIQKAERPPIMFTESLERWIKFFHTNNFLLTVFAIVGQGIHKCQS